MNKLPNKLAKQTLKAGNCKITIDGLTEYRYSEANDDWGQYPKIIRLSRSGNSFNNDNVMSSQGMNVDKYGSVRVHLYDYDLMGNKTTSKIAYSQINFL